MPNPEQPNIRESRFKNEPCTKTCSGSFKLHSMGQLQIITELINHFLCEISVECKRAFYGNHDPDRIRRYFRGGRLGTIGALSNVNVKLSSHCPGEIWTGLIVALSPWYSTVNV